MRKTTHRWAYRGLVGLMFAVLLVACGGVALAPSHHGISGTFMLSAAYPSITTDASGCQGVGGYGDIRAGAGVALKDGEGKILALGSLSAGKPSGPQTTGFAAQCGFTFSLADVPEVAFYSLEVSHRGASNYSLADMKAANWTVALTLGR